MAKYKKNPQQAPRQNQSQQSLLQTSTVTTSGVQPRKTERLRTIDQDRAQYALEQIQKIAQGSQTRQAEARRYITSLPALIRTNGLGQALAFYRTKGRDSSHEAIYKIVGQWLCAPDSKGRVFHEHGDDALTAITRSDVYCYMAAQNEALALLEWLKKFAVALLENEGN